MLAMLAPVRLGSPLRPGWWSWQGAWQATTPHQLAEDDAYPSGPLLPLRTADQAVHAPWGRPSLLHHHAATPAAAVQIGVGENDRRTAASGSTRLDRSAGSLITARVGWDRGAGRERCGDQWLQARPPTPSSARCYAEPLRGAGPGERLRWGGSAGSSRPDLGQNRWPTQLDVPDLNATGGDVSAPSRYAAYRRYEPAGGSRRTDRDGPLRRG
jgi:hypothetical protein